MFPIINFSMWFSVYTHNYCIFLTRIKHLWDSGRKRNSISLSVTSYMRLAEWIPVANFIQPHNLTLISSYCRSYWNSKLWGIIGYKRICFLCCDFTHPFFTLIKRDIVIFFSLIKLIKCALGLGQQFYITVDDREKML